MAIRRVLQIGDPRLKNKNKDIEDFSRKKLQLLIKDLKDTMHKNGLVGIAAPQIGINLNIFVTHPRNTKSRNIGKADILRVYINPKITELSKEQVVIYEGCGSVMKGQLFGPVKRPREITITAYNEKKQKFEITTDGLLARVIQHEYDHLKSVEFTEKIFDYKKLISYKFYKKNIRDIKDTKKLIKITKIKYKLYSSSISKEQ